MSGTPAAKVDKPKLERLPQGAKIQKRALLHPAIPASSSSEAKVIYISQKSSFAGTIKRVETLLGLGEKKELDQYELVGENGDKKLLQTLSKRAQKGKKRNEVSLKATGKQIEKALNLAIVLQKQKAVQVLIKTGSVSTVDDITMPEDDDRITAQDGREVKSTRTEVPEARVRKVPMLEVIVSLK